MANKTENRRQGCGNITIDTEVTENGIYPVEGKGIYAAINAAVGGMAAENVAHTDSSSPTAAKCAATINAVIDALVAAGLMEEPEG